MGGWVYRNLTLLVMASLAITLSMATVASTAPPEKRTVCQDGVTHEIPAHAKAKGATEGPCPEEGPDPLAEEICRTLYQGEIVVDSNNTCRFGYYETTFHQPDGITDVTGIAVYEVLWEGDKYADDAELVEIIPIECVDTSTDPPETLSLDDTRCDTSSHLGF